MSGKLIEADGIDRFLRDGMTIGIGGWGSRRKPMALVRGLVRSGVRDLTVVSFGGPDVGMLCATGQARHIVHGFVSLDSIALDPHFAAARQSGAVTQTELDENMLVAGLRAAARRLPFEATRSGLGSDALLRNPGIKTVRSPYDDSEELVAMPAIPLDLALVHLDRADPNGAAQCLGPDPYFDDLFARAATHTILSVDEVVATRALQDEHPSSFVLNRSEVTAVVEAPGGAHFTAALPHHPRDESLQRLYAQSASSPEDWTRFRESFVDVDEATYRRNVTTFAEKAT
ncbi:acyl CoA--acetate/3-ketoacid CoA transferase subunit alpha [Microbacterium sp. CFH 31415]|uniref:CoA transferase subunit A n=1 Tax=Microbacterium sp. CFH 31415 TaxID=2921732 RepID=UPI001F138D3A|nr:CoA-transferase [Microbacterium sp. CFH 31415]MCH6231594.1 acyl CoA--acetate/3-ketoacid CoA transferase subunit alpha [Microbacterium sp. CFH 31415]